MCQGEKVLEYTKEKPLNSFPRQTSTVVLVWLSLEELVLVEVT